MSAYFHRFAKKSNTVSVLYYDITIYHMPYVIMIHSLVYKLGYQEAIILGLVAKQSYCCFFFRLCLQHMEVPGPEMEPTSQQQPGPLQ